MNLIDQVAVREANAIFDAVADEPDPRRRAALMRSILQRVSRGLDRKVAGEVRDLAKAGVAPGEALPVAVTGAFRDYLRRSAEKRVGHSLGDIDLDAGLAGHNREERAAAGGRAVSGGQERDRGRDRGRDQGRDQGRSRDRDRRGRGRDAAQAIGAIAQGAGQIAQAIAQGRAGQAAGGAYPGGGAYPLDPSLTPGSDLGLSVTGPGGMSAGVKVALGGGGLLLLVLLYFLLVKPKTEAKSAAA